MMTDRDALDRVERLIHDCKNRIVSQSEVIANALEKGHDATVPMSMLRALEARLSAFEKDRQNIINRLKSGGSMTPTGIQRDEDLDDE